MVALLKKVVNLSFSGKNRVKKMTIEIRNLSKTNIKKSAYWERNKRIQQPLISYLSQKVESTISLFVGAQSQHDI